MTNKETCTNNVIRPVNASLFERIFLESITDLKESTNNCICSSSTSYPRDMMRFPIIINEFQVNSIKYVMREPYILNLEYKGDKWFYYDTSLDLYFYDNDVWEIKQQFISDFAELWKNYVLCDEKELGSSGLAFKKKLQYICEAKEL